MACRPRTYTSQAWLFTNADGKAFCNLPNGVAAVVCPRGAGWVNIYGGTASETFATSDQAIDDLINIAANEKILLRRR